MVGSGVKDQGLLWKVIIYIDIYQSSEGHLSVARRDQKVVQLLTIIILTFSAAVKKKKIYIQCVRL